MNKDNYKNAVNQIHASDELKEKTIRKMKQNKSNKISYIKILSSVAVVLIVFSIGLFEFNHNNPVEVDIEVVPHKTIAVVKNDLPRFKDMNELTEVLKENSYSYRSTSIMKSDIALTMNEVAQTEGVESVLEDYSATNSEIKQSDHSTTNVQVENVDEADIVKTDGEYIYYVTGTKVYIVDAKELDVVSTIQITGGKEYFNPSELFINKDKLVVLGNYYEYEEIIDRNDISVPEYELEDVAVSDTIGVTYSDSARITTRNTAKAIVYDISNKQDLKVIREVSLDGSYMNSRMIGDNVLFISRKYTYYFDGIKENEILPIVRDSASEEKEKTIACTDIAFFRGTDNQNFMLVGGFNMNTDEALCVETFYGASQDVYASENNLYLTQTTYDNDFNASTTIYKFELNGSQIVLKAKGEVEGYLNNQFSMDEYEGNLRLATTYTITRNMREFVYSVDEEEELEVPVTSIPETIYSNRLYVLDENLKEIGRIDDLAKDEKIYSVRFIGKMGYIVTFEQVDPLFVIDLSDPRNPEIKGELKIPGYSSYLHPYDENHIIGIGYNTKSNGHGGITTDNMKMSMFDVSDVQNPKEMFSIDIGDSYTYSNVLYNHKILFYKKSENLIGFPVSYNGKSRVEIFKIDLENGFEKCGEITQGNNYYGMDRAIYIEDILYTLNNKSIISYDLNTFEKIKELEFAKDEPTNYDDLVIAY